ncbi:MAG: hypothetical protein B7Y90_13450 [Alphaproteobacteria bacterium 32-64-14]|nr:MAG: hypothetical protein B7Y90_13450 [Alphaproteobacteria bacterium 32-64-14]
MLRGLLACALPISLVACGTSPPREIALEVRNVPAGGAQVLIQETFPGFLQPRAEYTRFLELTPGDTAMILEVCPPIRVRVVGYWSTLHLAKPIDWTAARPAVVVDVENLTTVPSLERDRELAERDRQEITDAHRSTRCVEPR